MTGVTPEPNYHGRQLQREIKKLREQARLTQQEAGERVHIEFRKLSRMERRQLPSYHELVMLLDAYGVLSNDYAPYLELWELAKKRAWWRDYHLKETRYIRMEDEADHKYEFQLGQIPTLLQTPAYARATFPRSSKKTVKTMTEVRMRQQDRLTNDPPLALHALIHAPALHQGVDRAQLHHLLDQAELPNVTLQIVPQDRYHEGLQSPLILLSFNDPNEPDIAFTESLIGLQETQDQERTATIKQVLEDLTAQALSPAETRKHLKSLAAGLPSTPKIPAQHPKHNTAAREASGAW
ncbi:transcriptional regulator with XRE-family HTH domain [Kibdelosporangium banguiense]|uniref:Transcriptional regulator with XRE-family HTH domain n=1 Tax=Kibdelosporangium banguiense TaxID=1365924 RepID=A0ABS4TTN0_9PSEU|nr:helix-turn-helix transcriptional regulator [Kibdelosporangium banguiense]MBP2327335.1 transcriptional regulator with XRE-family HTH domain [Kibdelosporangium banguiense]